MLAAYSDVNQKVGYVATCMATRIENGQLQESRVYCFVDDSGQMVEFYDPTLPSMHSPQPYPSTFENKARMKLQAGQVTTDAWTAQCAPDQLSKLTYGYYVFGPWNVTSVLWLDELSVSEASVIPAPKVAEPIHYTDSEWAGVVTLIDDVEALKSLALAYSVPPLKAYAKGGNLSIKAYPMKTHSQNKGGKESWPKLKHVAKGKGVAKW